MSTAKSSLPSIAPRATSFASVVTIFGLAFMLLLPAAAHASGAGFDVPFISDFGCKVVQWMKGPLAVLIFIMVIIATLVIGMITKMDWGRVITVSVIFGLIVAAGGILANSQYIQNVAGLSACLQ